MPSNRQKPTKDDLAGSRGREVPDVIAQGLKVLFCGINPGLYSAAVGHHFARPGNRFWPVIFRAGFTDRLLAPEEEMELVKYGYGITNIVSRATARADELSSEELRFGGAVLEQKVNHFSPLILAVLGLDAYRKAFGRVPVVGKQQERLGKTILWVLPNPSGINANYQISDLVGVYTTLKQATEP
jgi:double-stranded uracil-DNA glycosylase